VPVDTAADGTRTCRFTFQSDRPLTRLTQSAPIWRSLPVSIRHGPVHRSGGRRRGWRRIRGGSHAGAPAFRARGLPARPRGPASWVQSAAHEEIARRRTSWSRPFLPRIRNDRAAPQSPVVHRQAASVRSCFRGGASPARRLCGSMVYQSQRTSVNHISPGSMVGAIRVVGNLADQVVPTRTDGPRGDHRCWLTP